jgi:hypothetical protein
MTKTDAINAILLTAGVAFTGEAMAIIKTDPIMAVVFVVVGLAVFAVREVLP